MVVTGRNRTTCLLQSSVNTLFMCQFHTGTFPCWGGASELSHFIRDLRVATSPANLSGNSGFHRIYEQTHQRKQSLMYEIPIQRALKSDIAGAQNLLWLVSVFQRDEQGIIRCLIQRLLWTSRCSWPSTYHGSQLPAPTPHVYILDLDHDFYVSAK